MWEKEVWDKGGLEKRVAIVKEDGWTWHGIQRGQGKGIRWRDGGKWGKQTWGQDNKENRRLGREGDVVFVLEILFWTKELVWLVKFEFWQNESNYRGGRL